MNKRILLGLFLVILTVLAIYYARGKYTISFPRNPSSGIFGYVIVSPTCPGAQRPGEICSKPYKTTLIIKDANGQHVVSQISSNERGYYHISLSPGTYTIEGSSSPMPPLLVPVRVLIPRNRFIQENLNFDSGIR